MSSFVTKILAVSLMVHGLSTFALRAQTTVLRFTLDPSEQTNFWENIQGFKPHPIESEGDTATFHISEQVSRDSFCLRLLAHFRQKSFLLVSIDSSQSPINQSPITTLQSLILGPAMRWTSLQAGFGFNNENWLSAAGFRENFFTGKPLRHEAVLKIEQAVLEQAENNGYPFATVWLDSVVLDTGGAVSALLQVEKKRFFVFKNLRINGDVKLPKAFLPNYLGIKTGMPYSRARVFRLREQLRSLLFLETTANPTVTFANASKTSEVSENLRGLETGEATINLFLKKSGRAGLILSLASCHSRMPRTANFSSRDHSALLSKMRSTWESGFLPNWNGCDQRPKKLMFRQVCPMFLARHSARKGGLAFSAATAPGLMRKPRQGFRTFLWGAILFVFLGK